MDQEIKNKVFEYIDAIAEKLGVAAEFVFKALYMQIMLEGLVWTVLSILFLIIVSIAVWKTTKNLLKEYQENEGKRYSEKSEFWIFASIPVYGIGAIIYTIIILTLPTNILKLVNPDYYVIKYILDGLGIN